MKFSLSSVFAVATSLAFAFAEDQQDTTVVSPCVDSLVEFRFPMDDTLLKFCSIEQENEDTPPVLLFVEGTTDTSVVFDPYLSFYDPLLLCADMESSAEVENVYGDCASLPQDLIDQFQAIREQSNSSESSDFPPAEQEDSTGGSTGGAGDIVNLSVIKQSFTNGMTASTFQNTYCRPHNVHRHPIASCACKANQINNGLSYRLKSNDVFFTVAVVSAGVNVKLSTLDTTDPNNPTWVTEVETQVYAGMVYQFPVVWGTFKDRLLEVTPLYNTPYPGNAEYHFVGYIEEEAITCPPSGCSKKCRY